MKKLLKTTTMHSRYDHSGLRVFGLLVILFPAFGIAQDSDVTQQGGVNLGKAPLTSVKKPGTKFATSTTPSAVASTTLRELLIAKEVTIAAKDNAIFEAASDFTGTQTVGVSITSLSDPNTKLTNVRVGVAFAAPGDFYVLSDMIKCNTFYYQDHGGATVPVYGPLIKLLVFNDGATPVKITQLAVYAVAH